jgi:hypothetical protein
MHDHSIRSTGPPDQSRMLVFQLHYDPLRKDQSRPSSLVTTTSSRDTERSLEKPRGCLSHLNLRP